MDFIYGAVPSRSKNDILLVLQSCDYNVDAAISIFSQGKMIHKINILIPSSKICSSKALQIAPLI